MTKISKIKNKLSMIIDVLTNRDFKHSIITIAGNEIKCIESVELNIDESIVIIAKSRSRFSYKLVTINQEMIQYVTESFNKKSWDYCLGIKPIENETDDNSLYG